MCSCLLIYCIDAIVHWPLPSALSFTLFTTSTVGPRIGTGSPWPAVHDTDLSLPVPHLQLVLFLILHYFKYLYAVYARDDICMPRVLWDLSYDYEFCLLCCSVSSSMWSFNSILWFLVRFRPKLVDRSWLSTLFPYWVTNMDLQSLSTGQDTLLQCQTYHSHITSHVSIK